MNNRRIILGRVNILYYLCVTKNKILKNPRQYVKIIRLVPQAE